MIDYMKKNGTQTTTAMATKTWQNMRFSEKGNPDGCSYALFGSCCAARDSKHFRHSLRLRLALVSHNWMLDLFFCLGFCGPEKKILERNWKISHPWKWCDCSIKSRWKLQGKNPETAALNYWLPSLWVLLHERLKKCIVSSKGFMSGDSRFVSHSIPLCKRELVGQKKKKWKRQGQKQNNTTRRPSSGKPESNYHKKENNFLNKTEVLRRLG